MPLKRLINFRRLLSCNREIELPYVCNVQKFSCDFNYRAVKEKHPDERAASQFACDKVFNEQEAQLILHTVNTHAIEELQRYKISPSAMRTLIEYRAKNGQFNSIEDLLLTPGIDIPIINKFCKSVLKNGEGAVKKNGSIDSSLTPPLDHELANAIDSVTGIRVNGCTVSWAQINKKRELLSWACKTVKIDVKKTNILETIEAAAEVVLEMPMSDAYVVENEIFNSFSKLTAAAYYNRVHKERIFSTIVSLLGTRIPHLTAPKDCRFENAINNFYIMRSQVPARYFKLLVGNEAVMAKEVVENILNNVQNETIITPLEIHPYLRLKYDELDDFESEQMNWALLLAITAMDLSILSHGECKKLSSKSKKTKLSSHVVNKDGDD